MSEATRTREAADFYLQVGASVSAWEVWQLPSGEAAYYDRSTGLSSGRYTDGWKADGKVSVPKASGVYLLAGQEVWWDHSANEATYAPNNDRDFCLGTCVQDAAGSANRVEVDFNKRTRFAVDALAGPAVSNTNGTAAAGGFGPAQAVGGSVKLRLTATAEAQRVDLMSVDGRAPGCKGVVEAIFRVVSDGAGAEPDFNIGVASASHATDADAIAEHCFVHADGNNTSLLVRSRDAITTVAAVNTTLSYTEGPTVANRVHVLFDLRNLADIQVYINGDLAAGASTFRLDNAVGPLFLLAHLEKTNAAAVYEVDLDRFGMWTSQQ